MPTESEMLALGKQILIEANQFESNYNFHYGYPNNIVNKFTPYPECFNMTRDNSYRFYSDG